MTMKDETLAAIDGVLGFVSSSPWKDRYLLRVERLRGEVEEPCVLAVAGRVKAGKSTLINAMLGQDLSLTGATETTATINYFRYGNPEDPAKPIRCIWRNGLQTWESRAFLDGLQGTNEESLERAEALSHVEFYLPHPDLREITLVDTPGTDAIAGEGEDTHERTTCEFFGTAHSNDDGQQARRLGLRDRHSAETRQITGKADAVIYLVGQVAHVTNQEFLTEFRQTSSGQTRALNAVGVLSKVDLLDEVLEKRQELAAAVAGKLSAELNTVIPVSAGLWRALALLKGDRKRLTSMRESLCSIPEERLSRMLTNDRAFLREYPDCPVPVEERRALLNGIPWRVFVLLARELRLRSINEALGNLEALSGFVELKALLNNHFFQRGRFLRCFRIVSDLYAILGEIHRTAMYELRQGIRSAKAELLEFTDFIIEHPRGQSETANRLRRYLTDHMPTDNTAELEAALAGLIGRVEDVRASLEVVNRQFHGLQLLDEAGAAAFEAEELRELRILFGLYAQGEQGGAPDPLANAAKRQIFWRQSEFQSRDPVRRQVAVLAQFFYGQALQRAVVAGGDAKR